MEVSTDNRYKISLFGDILIDLVYNDGKFTPEIGGSIFNTARTLSRLGAKISYISSIGNDYWGKYIINSLLSANIDTSNIIISDKIKTSLAFAIPSTNNDGKTKYDFYKSTDKCKYNVKSIIGSNIFHFGSSFSIKRTNRDNIDNFLRICKKSGIITSYDPNYRAGVSDTGSIIKLMKKSDIIKASDEDLANIFGETNLQGSNLHDKIELLRSWGAKLIVITLGQSGAVGSCRPSEYVYVPAPLVTIVNTIGAGDNFAAGLLSYIYDNNIRDFASISPAELQSMLKFANKIAGESLQRIGG